MNDDTPVTGDEIPAIPGVSEVSEEISDTITPPVTTEDVPELPVNPVGGEPRREASGEYFAELKPVQSGKRGVIIGTAIAAIVLAAGLGIFFSSRSADTNSGGSGKAIPQGASSFGGPVVVGNKDAKTTLTLWEDFQCPACNRFEQTAGAIVQEAIAKGTAKVEYHMVSFLDGGKVGASNRAANASFCAADQGKFVEFHSWAYAHQPAEHSDGFKNPDLIAYGPNIGIADQGKYASCINDGTYLPFAASQTEAMIPNKIQGTPTILINGKELSQEQNSLEGFAKALGVPVVTPGVTSAPSPSPK